MMALPGGKRTGEEGSDSLHPAAVSAAVREGCRPEKVCAEFLLLRAKGFKM